MHVSLCVCCVRAFTFHVLLLKEALKPVTAFRFGCGPNLPPLLPLLPLILPSPSAVDRRPQNFTPLPPGSDPWDPTAVPCEGGSVGAPGV